MFIVFILVLNSEIMYSFKYNYSGLTSSIMYSWLIYTNEMFSLILNLQISYKKSFSKKGFQLETLLINIVSTSFYKEIQLSSIYSEPLLIWYFPIIFTYERHLATEEKFWKEAFYFTHFYNLSLICIERAQVETDFVLLKVISLVPASMLIKFCSLQYILDVTLQHPFSYDPATSLVILKVAPLCKLSKGLWPFPQVTISSSYYPFLLLFWFWILSSFLVLYVK